VAAFGAIDDVVSNDLTSGPPVHELRPISILASRLLYRSTSLSSQEGRCDHRRVVLALNIGRFVSLWQGAVSKAG
jgi:hypothetical protein